MDESEVRGPRAPATGFEATEAQVQARVAWYYYVGGMTQQEIANRLGLTRLRVNRIVGQVRSDGLVRIEVKLPLANCVALEERLKARYSLDDVTVVPSVSDLDIQQQMIGEAAGAMLDLLLDDGIGLGVGWGRTLRAAARRLTARRLNGSWVAALMGGPTRGSGTNTFEVATEFARTLGAECYYVPAPIYCPSVESRSTLLTHYGLADAMRRARGRCRAGLGRRSLLAFPAGFDLHRFGESSRAQGRRRRRRLVGSYLDEYGRIIDHSLNKRVMALSLEELKDYPTSILASGGEHKLAVVRAVLNARYVRRLVTDEAVAGALA
jgi:DNA-binding transcriptional regulator LsrR (DeoR family)